MPSRAYRAVALDGFMKTSEAYLFVKRGFTSVLSGIEKDPYGRKASVQRSIVMSLALAVRRASHDLFLSFVGVDHFDLKIGGVKRAVKFTPVTSYEGKRGAIKVEFWDGSKDMVLNCKKTPHMRSYFFSGVINRGLYFNHPSFGRVKVGIPIVNGNVDIDGDATVSSSADASE